MAKDEPEAEGELVTGRDTASFVKSEHIRGLWVRLNAFLGLKSKNTQRTYIGVIQEWCDFLGVSVGSPEAETKLIAVTELDAAAYRAWLEKQPGQSSRLGVTKTKEEERPTSLLPSLSFSTRTSSHADGTQDTLSNATIAKKLTILRRIYRLFVTTGLSELPNPFESELVTPPQARSGQKRPTEMVDFEKVMEIIEVPDTETAKGRRDKALLAVLFGGGLRRAEVAKLILGDVRRTQEGVPFLRLRATKSGKDSDQPLPPWAIVAVEAVLVDRCDAGAEPGSPLFVSFRGKGGGVPTEKPISTNGIYRLFQRCCRAAGVHEPVSPHSARATAITKLLSDGVSHRDVQEFSRHASVQMVEVYDKRRLTIDDNPGATLGFQKKKKE